MTTTKSDFISQQPALTAPGPKPSKKLYSMAALMRERQFAGHFETPSASYEFTYTPTLAQLTGGKLELTGNLQVGAARRGLKREAKGVRATLLAMQGGINSVPAVITMRNKLNPARGSLPFTEATDQTGYVGVMYFRLSPVNARALGLTIDLSNVQLNARLYPKTPLEQELHIVYTDLVGAAYQERPDSKEAAKQLAALNQLLAKG